jgi:hypothetical protein
MKPFSSGETTPVTGRKSITRKPVSRATVPVLAALSMAGPIAWLTLPSAQVKTGYTLPAGPDPRR